MCGFIGLLSSKKSFDPKRFSEAVNVMQQRGPDDRGVCTELVNNETLVAMGHRRLSILDLSQRGKQPMVSPRTGSIIVYNGEVYNYKIIRRELESQGFAFHSDCDTEVILAAYDHWGLDCVKRFNGMFAIMIYDKPGQKLVITRDRIGIKPLYYFHNEESFGASSDLTSLVSLRKMKKDIDTEALKDYFAYGYYSRELTPLIGYKKLLPGHTLIYDIGKADIKTSQYWNIMDYIIAPRLQMDENEIIDATAEIIEDSVSLRMISDVPLGVFLSGGIDSSLVAACANKVSNTKMKTFTVGFSEEDMDEAPYAKKIANHLGTEHYELYVSDVGLTEALNKVLEYHDEPMADTSSIPTYLLSAMTKKYVTVALSGDGGDELQYGYKRYRTAYMHNIIKNTPRIIRNAILGLTGMIPNRRIKGWPDMLSQKNTETFYSVQQRWRNPGPLGKISGNSVWHNNAISIGEMMGINRWKEIPPIIDMLSYLPDDLLKKVDQASMAVSLEARVPLLDHRLIEYSCRIPLGIKYKEKQSKYVFKEILARYLPRDMFIRPKKGFGIPIGKWFRGSLKEWVKEELSGDWNWTQGIVTPAIVGQYIDDHMNGRNNYSNIIWAMLCMNAWAHKVGISR